MIYLVIILLAGTLIVRIPLLIQGIRDKDKRKILSELFFVVLILVMAYMLFYGGR